LVDFLLYGLPVPIRIGVVRRIDGLLFQCLENLHRGLHRALRDLEQAAGIAISAKQTLTAEERLEILKKARDLRNFAGFIIDRIESMERAALN